MRASGLERFAFLDADRSKQATGFQIQHTERALHQSSMQMLVKAVVVGVNGIEGLARTTDVFHLRWIVFLG
jgi:hypothetical protein